MCNEPKATLIVTLHTSLLVSSECNGKERGTGADLLIVRSVTTIVVVKRTYSRHDMLYENKHGVHKVT